MTYQIFISVQTLAMPCYLEMALCRSGCISDISKIITVPIFSMRAVKESK